MSLCFVYQGLHSPGSGAPWVSPGARWPTPPLGVQKQRQIHPGGGGGHLPGGHHREKEGDWVGYRGLTSTVQCVVTSDDIGFELNIEFTNPVGMIWNDYHAKTETSSCRMTIFFSSYPTIPCSSFPFTFDSTVNKATGRFKQKTSCSGHCLQQEWRCFGPLFSADR